MLEAQHEHLSKLINTTEVSSERVTHAAALLQAHRRARVASTSSTLRTLLGTVNFMSGTVHQMAAFASVSATQAALGKETGTTTEGTSDGNNGNGNGLIGAAESASSGVMPVPGTAELASRHALYTSLLAQGWTGAASPATPATSTTPVVPANANTAPTKPPPNITNTTTNSTNTTNANTDTDTDADMLSASAVVIAKKPFKKPAPPTHHLSCWHMYTLNSSDLDVAALRSGLPAAFLVQVSVCVRRPRYFLLQVLTTYYEYTIRRPRYS